MKILFIISLLVLVACGKQGAGIISGGEGDDAPSGGMASRIVGNYAGLVYNSETFSGTVSAAGAFQCKRGEQVDFYLTTSARRYDIHVGSTACVEVISPIDLVTWGAFGVDSNVEAMGFSGIGKNYKVGLVRWLTLVYLLDSDKNENNGVSFTLAKNNIFAQNISNNPFHPDQIFGNYTTSNVTSVSEFNTLVNRIETFYGDVSLAESDLLLLLDESRLGCSSYACASRELF